MLLFKFIQGRRLQKMLEILATLTTPGYAKKGPHPSNHMSVQVAKS